MSDANNHSTPRVRRGPIKWLTQSIRASIESSVSRHLHHQWSIRTEVDFSEFSCHKSAVLADGSFGVFVKFGTDDKASLRFEIELEGLQALSNGAGVLIPEPVDIVRAEEGTVLILRALKAIDRGPEQWRQIGSTLARLHRVDAQYFGYISDGFWGPLEQDNTKAQDGVAFFRERRLLPLLKTACDSGNIPPSVISHVELLATRLPELCGPQLAPTLLHGDAQQNNFISTAEGTYVIDPAVYFGHPEWDLALIDSWQPVPSTVLDGYRSERPIDPGFGERRDLWRVPLYLAAVALEGAMHLERLTNALKTYR